MTKKPSVWSGTRAQRRSRRCDQAAAVSQRLPSPSPSPQAGEDRLKADGLLQTATASWRRPLQASTNGSCRCRLPVSRYSALAMAGAMAGTPGRPGRRVVLRGHEEHVDHRCVGDARRRVVGKLLFFTTPFSISMAKPGLVMARPNTQARGSGPRRSSGYHRLACTPAVTRCTRGSPLSSETSAIGHHRADSCTATPQAWPRAAALAVAGLLHGELQRRALARVLGLVSARGGRPPGACRPPSAVRPPAFP